MINVCTHKNDWGFETLGRCADLVYPILDSCDGFITFIGFEDNEVDTPRCQEELMCWVEHFLPAEVICLEDDVRPLLDTIRLSLLLRCFDRCSQTN